MSVMTRCAIPNAKVRKIFEFLTILRGDPRAILAEVTIFLLLDYS